MSVVAVEQMIIELCKETGEPGLTNNQTLFGNILDGIRDMAIFNMPTWETKKDLQLNSYNAFEWPCSCVKPLITFMMRNGRALALDVDDNILRTVDTKVTDFATADAEIQDFFRMDNYEGFYGAYTWGWGLGEVYGYGAGYRNVGVVTHDPKRRQSFIKGCRTLTTDTFGILFKSDGLSDDIEFVPAICKEPLENFALYKYYRVRNPNLSAVFFDKYTQFCYRLTKFNDDDGVEAWSTAVASNTKSSPKGVF